MRAAYLGKWYHTLTFTQKTTQHRADGSTNVTTWFESLRHTTAGGVQLRIDIGKPSEGNGMLYTADSLWRVRGGQAAAATGDGNPFLPLIEGVYVQPLARTVEEVKHMKVDMSRVRSGRWRDRDVWIVGAGSATDTTSPQFWVDKERNVVSRAILEVGQGRTLDIRLDGYVPAGKGWLATKITMLAGGKPLQTEEYSDWKTDVDLPPSLFDLKTWTTAPHWAKDK